MIFSTVACCKFNGYYLKSVFFTMKIKTVCVFSQASKLRKLKLCVKQQFLDI